MIFVFVIMPMPVFCYWKHFSLCLSMYNVVVYVDTQVIANRGTCLVARMGLECSILSFLAQIIFRKNKFH